MLQSAMLTHPLPQQPAINLSGAWEFRLDGEKAWRPSSVPGCWEAAGAPKDHSGPVWYRTTLAIPAEWSERRIWLGFGAVSYHCEIFVNSEKIGEHTGLWDAFAVEISAAVAPGSSAELLLRIEKPAGLAAGPDSARLPGRFPLRETLAGFLPYVWGHIFGGIWQDVALFATGLAVFEDIWVRGDASGHVQIEIALSAPAAVELELRDPSGQLLLHSTSIMLDGENTSGSASTGIPPAQTRTQFECLISAPQAWSPHTPSLYTAHLSIAESDQRVIRFGLRSLRAEGAALLLNGQPIYPRMALSWGWYPEALNSNPGPERVRADFERLKQLGYNGVKLCLWFPPQYYFELADELGMLLWVELPMWIPQPSAFFRAQTPVEYDRLMRLARQHPSVILYTLGCELSRAADAQLLAPLYALAKQHAHDALVRDNSGSGEAYGGLLTEFAEFYDYHFYCDLQHMRGLLDYFSPRGRPAQPWLFGEFCDYDTFRDLRGFETERQGDKQTRSDPKDLVCLSPALLVSPWWLSSDPAANPQGARWLYEVVSHKQRLIANGLWQRGAEIQRISEAQGLLHRKYTLELVRLYHEISGYVVTGEADTPVSTAGMWDEHGRLKFEPDAFRAFNGDLVLLAGWDRRREWVAGGDRAAPWDTWSYLAGSTVRAHLIASHYGRAHGPAHLAWSVAFEGQPPFAQGQAETSFALVPGNLRELAVAEFVAPAVSAPRQALLSAEIAVGGEQAHNSWPIWLFPRRAWGGTITLYDPLRLLQDLQQLAPGIRKAETFGDADPSTAVWIATSWAPELGTYLGAGGRVILIQAGAGPAGPLPVAALPFWREAIRLAAPHPAWGDFPLDDALGMQLFGCATDYALDLAQTERPWQPILRRLDARTMQLHEYVAELIWGAGHLIATTLRFAGGQGAQPAGIARNTAAADLLWCWVEYLRRLP